MFILKPYLSVSLKHIVAKISAEIFDLNIFDPCDSMYSTSLITATIELQSISHADGCLK